jgi:glycosyltransferase involved in cell wall biosynthesis
MHIVLTTNTSFVAANFRAGLIKALLAEGHSITVLASHDAFSKKLTSMGCQVIPIDIDRNGTNPFSEARALIAIYRNLKRIRPDIVFSFTIKNNIYAGLACRTLGIPIAPNVTGLGPAFGSSGALNWLVRNLYRIAFRKARKVFFQNSDDRDVFLNAELVPDERAHLLPGSGVDLTKFGMAPMPKGDESIHFLLVARMLEDKGVGLFVDAAQQVKAAHPRARFQLLGPIDSDSRTAIAKAEIDRWVSDGLVEYLGTKTDVRPALLQAHCIVLPSYYHEGTPRSLLEAGAMGRPIITTDMPGCRDTISQGVNGFLVHPRDATDLARAMQSFVALSANERQAMGLASRRLMEAKYDEKFVINAYLTLMASSLKNE